MVELTANRISEAFYKAMYLGGNEFPQLNLILDHQKDAEVI